MVVLALAVLVPAGAGAASSRLDARTRAAIATLRARREGREIAPCRPLALDAGNALDVFIRGTASRDALESAGARVRTAVPGVCTASVPEDAIERVASLDGVLGIRGAAVAEPELSASVPATGATLLRGPGPDFAGLGGQGVLVGSVDTGVDFGHGDFVDAAGHTRFVAIWDQTVPGAGVPGRPYGTAWTRHEIDAGLCVEADSSGHGTHVLGIAAGDGSQTGAGIAAFTYTGMAPAADLAFVKTDLSTTGILDGVAWLFEVAASRGQCAVVNLSLGSQFGPHDGSSEFEQGLESLAGPGRIIVKSAGNDRGSAKHGEVFATAGGASVTLSVSGSAVGRVFAVDGYYDAADQLRVQLVTPGGLVIGPLVLDAENAPYPGLSTPNGDVYLAQDALPSGRTNVTLEVGAMTTAQSLNGTWTITFFADALGPAGGQVDLWRYFASSGVNANFVTGSQALRELVSEPGNAADVITVGACVTRPTWTACNGATSWFSGTPAVGNLSTFSSPGPTRDGRRKPDLTAPGEAIVSTATFDIARTCPAPPSASTSINDGMNHLAMRGTSMAAPHVTGAAALLLQKRGALTPAEVRDYFASHARLDGATGPQPGNDWGSGKLDLGDLVDPTVTLLGPGSGQDATIGQTLQVTWSAADALSSVAGVDVELSRDGPSGPFESLAAGLPNTGSWSWNVSGPPTLGGRAWLRVVAHDTNGNSASDSSDQGFTIHSPLAVGVAPAPAFALGEARPNPALGRVRIAYVVGRDAAVRLTVCDVQGRRVATLADGPHRAGRHEAWWDPARGAHVPAGLYFVTYETPDARFVRRLALTP